MRLKCQKCGSRLVVPEEKAHLGINCPDCGASLSPGPATIQLSRRSGPLVLVMTALISFAAGMVFVLVLIQARDFRAKTVTQPSPAAPPAVEEMAENAGLKDEKPDLVTPANMLWRFYENAVIGDTQYKGKLIQTYQAANGIEGDGHGGYVLCLQTMQVGLAPGRLEYGVVCHIDANDKAEFTKVAKGFDVTVIGRCVGRKEDRTKFGGYVVVLEHCRYSPEQLHLESAPRR